jgi:hypothetical protein
MGLTLEFYLGDAERIALAIQEVDLETLYDPQVVQQKADFSLHILPKDLNLLSRAIGAAAGISPIELRDHLTVLIDEVDRGMLEVDRVWIDYAASASQDDVPRISKAWVDAMNHQYAGDAVLSDDLVQAVHDLLAICKSAQASDRQVLLAICKAAQASDRQVLHGWFG